MPIERTIFVTNQTVHAVVGQVRIAPHESFAVVTFNDGQDQMVVFERWVKARAFAQQVNRFHRGQRRIRSIRFRQA